MRLTAAATRSILNWFNLATYWMEEVGLRIGRVSGIFNGIEQEQLAWFDRHNCRYVSGDERAELEQLRAEKLAEYLRSIGIDPDHLPVD